MNDEMESAMVKSRFENQRQTQVLETTLGLLDALENGEELSQRGLAGRLGVALGLTNSLIKRCLRKGLIKVSEAPARRYAYYLTPKGFQEKAKLTADYLSSSLDFFRHSRAQYLEITEYCIARGWKRIALHGTSELAEVATLAGNEIGVSYVVVIEPGRNVARFCDIPVIQDIGDYREECGIDAIILTDTINPQSSYDNLIKVFPKDRIFAPDILRLTKLQKTPNDANQENTP